MCHCHVKLLFIPIAILFIMNSHFKECGASIQIHHQSPQNDFLINALPQEKMDQLKIPKDQTLIVRLPSNTLLKYTAYKDVSILHFRVPHNTKTAFFTFKAFEESRSAFHRKCKPRDVTVHLKAGSYPVISPENITFPKNFLNSNERSKIYNLQFKSDESRQYVTVDGPQVGNWFAVSFMSWTDPNNDRIEQQGLAASCETLLLGEMAVSYFKPIIINNGQMHESTLTSKKDEQSFSIVSALKAYPKQKEALKTSSYQSFDDNTTTKNEIIYKFYVPENIGIATALITITQECVECPDLGIYIQANALPRTVTSNTDERNYMHSSIIKPNQTGEISLEFYVQPNTWHYALFKFVNVLSGSMMMFEESTKNVTSTPPSAQSYDEKDVKFKTKTHILKYFTKIEFNVPTDLFDGVFKENLSNTNSTEDILINKFENVNSSTSFIENEWRPVRFRNMEFYPLLRQTYREFFMFDYDLIPNANGTVPTLLNLTAGTPAGFYFNVGDVYDIGGTLSFGVSMKHSLKSINTLKSMSVISSVTERSGILAEKLTGQSLEEAKDDFSEGDHKKALPRSNQTIIVCMHLGEPGQPTWPDKCRYGRKLLQASSIVNNTDLNTSTGLIHVPFPESGQWYITMGLYCHGAETVARVTIIDSVKEFISKYAPMLQLMRSPCACATSVPYLYKCVNDKKCLVALNETETLRVKECLMDSKCTSNYIEMTKKFENHHKSATEQQFELENCNTSVVFTISSSPCVAGRCGRFGRCYHYMSGGFVFSTCVCNKGYRGWDCTEDTQVPSSMSILLASLLLTLSNLLFFPSIYIAMRRKYYTEAVIYFFAMFFSIFYHACDSGEDEYSFCLVKINVLQFCDFYCGLLAIWVTLVAMANIRPQLISLLHMFGAILLAFGTELNKQSLWVFLAPALSGICIISASWGLRCYKSRKWYPAKSYLTVFMPLGMVLVMVGLICYAFLQTKQNYHVVHSIWHMVMALSILCLLPSRKSFIPKC